MIVAMKKVTVLVLESRKDRELSHLKRLGVLHPTIERRSSEKSEDLRAKADVLDKALVQLSDSGEVPQDPIPGVSSEVLSEAISSAGAILSLRERSRELEEQLAAVRLELERISIWGEFNPDDIRDLESRGVHIRLFVMNRKDYVNRSPAGLIELGRKGNDILLAGTSLASGESEASDDEQDGVKEVPEFRLPDKAPAELRREAEEKEREIEAAREELSGYGSRRDLMMEGRREIERNLEHEIVRLGMDDEARVSFITGYIPSEAEEGLRETARNNGWGLLIRDPEPGDEVPTRIRNPRWIRTIRPVFNMLGVVPGYRERDISMWFLLFFTVFVGMIIGDAGYGTLLFITALFAIISAKRKGRVVGEAVVLLTVLSLSTVAWGAITGNWFGYEPISRIRPFSLAVIPSFSSFDPRSTQSVQRLCFILAAVHLSIAHLWNFLREIREKPAIKAFAQLGWLSAVLGLFFLVMSLFLGQEMPRYAAYMIFAGMGFVLLFSRQSADTGFFGGILRAFSDALPIVFDGIGAFSDIISYIRLFAVGLASVAIAQAFNEMASSVGSSPVGYVLAAVILFFGHSLNLVMGGLAVVVHGVRLNLLEFSGHLGMEWTGVEYRPFAENADNT